MPRGALSPLTTPLSLALYFLGFPRQYPHLAVSSSPHLPDRSHFYQPPRLQLTCYLPGEAFLPALSSRALLAGIPHTIFMPAGICVSDYWISVHLTNKSLCSTKLETMCVPCTDTAQDSARAWDTLELTAEPPPRALVLGYHWGTREAGVAQCVSRAFWSGSSCGPCDALWTFVAAPFSTMAQREKRWWREQTACVRGCCHALSSCIWKGVAFIQTSGSARLVRDLGKFLGSLGLCCRRGTPG